MAGNAARASLAESPTLVPSDGFTALWLWAVMLALPQAAGSRLCASDSQSRLVGAGDSRSTPLAKQ